MGFIKSKFTVIGLCVISSWQAACGMCGEEMIGESRSPEGSYVVRAYVRNCGATTGYVTHTNLRSRWSRFSTSWEGTVTVGEFFVNAC